MPALLSLSVLIVIWQLVGILHLLPQYIFPTPLEIVRALVRDHSLLLFHARITLLEAAIGLSCGTILAIALALIMDSISWLRQAVYPLLILTQTIPTVALAPILVLWLGYGLAPKIVLIILTTTFPIVISILDGFRNCDPDMVTLLQLMRANRLSILWHLKIPASMSYFYAGFRVSVSYAILSAVVAEWLGGFEGLGVYMIRAKKLFQYDTMFAIITLVSALSLLCMEGVRRSEPLMLPWKAAEAQVERNHNHDPS